MREPIKQSQGGGKGGHSDNKDQWELGQGEEDRQKLCSERDAERETVTQKARTAHQMVTRLTPIGKGWCKQKA